MMKNDMSDKIKLRHWMDQGERGVDDGTFNLPLGPISSQNNSVGIIGYESHSGN